MRSAGRVSRASNPMAVESVRSIVTVALPAERAFAFFTEHFTLWWPREYTWGREALEEIGLERREGGFCFERGPHGFRCDWGRILAWEPPRRLVLAWQISPRHEPEPNPARASTVEITFLAETPMQTRVVLDHRDFERHGEEAAEYRAALASREGWSSILDRFRTGACPDST